MLMICVARPELLEMRAAWGAGAAAATSLTVDPFGDAESRVLIENLLGQPALEEGVLDAVTQAADGNPLLEKSVFSTVAAMLALTSFKQARYDEADLFTRMSEEAAGKADVASRVLWRSVRASLFTNRGDIQAGEGLAREAVEIAEESEALNIQGDALLSLAQVLSSARPREACAVASEALKRYQRKGNLVSAAKAEAFLVEHAAPSADRL
jgi:hypothetical protein